MGYQPLFGVTARHDYFGDEPCPALEFVADTRSAALQGRAGLLFEPSPGRVRVYYDDTRLDSLRLHASSPDEPLRLVFRLRATDSALTSYTDSDSIATDAVHYYSSRSVETDGVAARWSRPDRITEQDFELVKKIAGSDPTADPGLRSLRADPRLMELVGAVEPRDWVVRPVAIVSIFVPPPTEGDRFPPADSIEYRLDFHALRTIWKYYLLGDLAKKESVIITDSREGDEGAGFARGPKEDLPGNRVALTFRSMSPIPLRLRSDLRFQLRENGKVLIKRLPVASPESFGSVEMNDGKKTFVSDIYING